MHYNTTNEKGLELERARDATLTQDSRVLAVYASRDEGVMLSPWAVKEIMSTEAPITSIRRSINTLTLKGLLVKTIIKVIGPYGRPNYCWRINNEITATA